MDGINLINKPVNNGNVFHEHTYPEINGDGSEGEAGEKWTHVGRAASGRHNNKKKVKTVVQLDQTHANTHVIKQASNRCFFGQKDDPVEGKLNQLVRNRNSFPDTIHVTNGHVPNPSMTKQSSDPNSTINSPSPSSSVHDLHSNPDTVNGKVGRPHSRYHRTNKNLHTDNGPTHHPPLVTTNSSNSKPYGPSQNIHSSHSFSNSSNHPGEQWRRYGPQWRRPHASLPFGTRPGSHYHRYNEPRFHGNQSFRFRQPVAVSVSTAEPRVPSPVLVKSEADQNTSNTATIHLCTDSHLNNDVSSQTKNSISTNTQPDYQPPQPCTDFSNSVVEFLLQQWNEFQCQI